tara:strand:+ start:155689 stop:155934 length:246 start_codon:yes stop_codon:yes gene_type:complete
MKHLKKVILKHDKTVPATPTPEQLNVYKNNFYGLLTELGVSMDLFEICLLINDIDDPMDTSKLKDNIYIPDVGYVKQLLQM